MILNINYLIKFVENHNLRKKILILWENDLLLNIDFKLKYIFKILIYFTLTWKNDHFLKSFMIVTQWYDWKNFGKYSYLSKIISHQN